MATKAIVVFTLTYVLISVQKIPYFRHDRPSASLLGAVLMVVLGVMSLDEAYHAIDLNTITLLLGMMILIAYLRLAQFFRFLSWWIVSHAHTPLRLLVFLVWSAGLLSALFVNDTICLMFTPMVLAVARDARLNPVPFLIALATASNIGSVMTLTGNPQNMLVGIFSKWPYGEFFVWMLPIGFVSLWLDVLVIYVLFRQDITRMPFDHLTLVKPLVNVRLVRKVWLVLIGVLLGFVFIGNLPLVAIVGGVAIGIIARKPPSDALEKVDWDLLLFFCGLFIVVAGINKSGVVDSLHAEAASYFGSTAASQIAVFSAFSVLVSNIVSNVPFVMLAAKWIAGFANPKLMWFVLAMSSTFAGNFTIVGSVANMIVMELSKDDVHVGFWQFFKVGATITVLTTAVGVALCIAYSHLGLVR